MIMRLVASFMRRVRTSWHQPVFSVVAIFVALMFISAGGLLYFGRRVGHGVTWADTHGSIYPFDRLRRACPCGECAEVESLTPAMGWPRDIQKQAAGLSVTWTDEHQSFYPYPDLRAGCQCAACTGGH